MKKPKKTSKAKKPINEKIGAEQFSSSLAHRIREGLFILGLAVSVFLIVALSTYHNTDPGWSRTGAGAQVANATGRFGAWLADVLLYGFGYLAYIFPIMLGYGAWILFREGRYKAAVEPKFLIMRVLGFILILVAGSALFNIHTISYSSILPSQPGGIIGATLDGLMLPIVSTMGTSLIFLACVLIGITLFTGLSWLWLLETVGKQGVSFLIFATTNLKLLFKKSYVSFTTYLQNRRTKALNLPTIKRKERVAPVVAENAPIEIVPPPRMLNTKQKPVVAISEPATAAVSFQVPKTKGLPSLELLDPPNLNDRVNHSKERLEILSQEVEATLRDYGIDAKVVAVHPGPVVTRYELQLSAGMKVSKISNLAKDLARSLTVTSVRIVEVIPGKTTIGLELPNEQREMVCLREILQSDRYQNGSGDLLLAFGKDVAGFPVVVDLSKMPHLLIAGTTGSGKSVGLNACLLSLLYRSTPEKLRLILIDPKMLELSVYEGIPHLLAPVVIDMKEAANALRWCVYEMERRYKLMSKLGVRNLHGYNQKVQAAIDKKEPIVDPLAAPEDPDKGTLEQLPHIVVVVDELADMMMVVGKKVEELIARLAQKARAAGIHVILATQRPSVDVITGLIKSNIPTRVSFQVSSKIDSRTVLDQGGAEQLLGHGDMLYLPPGMPHPMRVHGAFVDDDEVHRVVKDWKDRAEPNYIEGLLDGASEQEGPDALQGNLFMGGAESDPFYDQAVALITEKRRVSVSMLQRYFKIGYNRAARIVEDMEAAGVVTPMESNGTREVIAPRPYEE